MPDIIHFFMINAPPETIYKAITTQKGLRGWWTEEAYAQADVGSIAEFSFGDKYHNEMKITTLLENENEE